MRTQTSPLVLKLMGMDKFEMSCPNATLEAGTIGMFIVGIVRNCGFHNHWKHSRPLGPTETTIDTYSYVFSQAYNLFFSYQLMLEIAI